MAIIVHPGAPNPTHEISLSDGVQTWGLKLDGGPGALQEIPMTPSTLQFTGGGSKFGDWEPGMSHIEQRTWEGGRGLEDFAEDSTRYYDSMNAWTLTPGRVMPAPQWRFAKGLRESYEELPGNVSWRALLGNEKYVSAAITVGESGFDVQAAYIWLRRKGSPGVLTAAIYSDSGGEPDEALPNSSQSVSIADVEDVVSVFQVFDVSQSADLAADTVYHLVVYASANDNAANHWEVGVYTFGEGARISVDGISWSQATYSLYHRIVDAGIKRRMHMFELEGALYAVDEREDGSAAKLYMNGDRGVQNDSVSGSQSVSNLVDEDKSWVADRWAGAWVRIVSGSGEGQQRLLESNTADTLVLGADWDVTPDNTTNYVIYATDEWADITPDSGDQFSAPVSSVVVFNDIVAFAQGQAANVLKMRFNAAASPPAHDFDADSNKADLLYVFYDPDDGAQVWRASNDVKTVSRSNPTLWGINLSFATAIEIGEDSAPITRLVDYNYQLWILKTDSAWVIDKDANDNDIARKLNLGLSALRDVRNGLAATVQKGFLYFSVGHSLGRMYQSSLDDVGPWKGVLRPDKRHGHIGALLPLGIEWLAVGVDGGDENLSSVLVYDGAGWHELMRGWEMGQRVEGLYWQACPGTRARLWVNVGGELILLEFPKDTLIPLRDRGLAYQHECIIETATIDMGAARLPKFIKEMSLVSENLTTGIEVHLDYQVDDEIGGDKWISAETFYSSPEDTLPINAGDVRAIRLRFRMLTNQSDVPPIGIASIVEGFSRTPLKYQWNMRIKLADMQSNKSGGIERDADGFLQWLKDAARQARKVRMRSIWQGMDDVYVIVEPPTLLRQFTNTVTGWWGGSVNITLREA
ncbi:MAG: hypothetical protein DWQ07_23245 [Chloroflexi bacterium]|nr:MAG: hypothetical protein DWQ07_23245 [Chloroflexota bacterium]MBL1194066.1 hypothetical protein [Chloroflexota bacterium]NOH11360.1 hypothetical protein [Chloroflexota bacterium]